MLVDCELSQAPAFGDSIPSASWWRRWTGNIPAICSTSCSSSRTRGSRLESAALSSPISRAITGLWHSKSRSRSLARRRHFLQNLSDKGQVADFNKIGPNHLQFAVSLEKLRVPHAPIVHLTLRITDSAKQYSMQPRNPLLWSYRKLVTPRIGRAALSRGAYRLQFSPEGILAVRCDRPRQLEALEGDLGKGTGSYCAPTMRRARRGTSQARQLM